MRTETSKICLSCMKCCKTIGILTSYLYEDKEIREFYEARGAKVSEKAVGVGVDFEKLIFLEFNFSCPNLDPEKGCKIYDTRPEICRRYPEDVSQLLDGCGLYNHKFV